MPPQELLNRSCFSVSYKNSDWFIHPLQGTVRDGRTASFGCTKQTIYHTALLTLRVRATHYSVQPNLINICAARKMWHPCTPQYPDCLGQWGKKINKYPAHSRLKPSSSPHLCILKHTARPGVMPVMRAVNESEPFDLRRDFAHVFFMWRCEVGGGAHCQLSECRYWMIIFSTDGQMFPRTVCCSKDEILYMSETITPFSKRGASALCPTP